jgi:regulation of enolase protein 1 (concanavalin A-like superfamily)
MRDIGWNTATWLNEPPDARIDGADLVVTTAPNSDFWRTTSYGYVQDTGHALLAPFPAGTAVETTFVAAFDELYDQAGVMVRVDPRTWIKAGTELTDGAPHLGAVVTNGQSDWSQAPVPDWAGRSVTMRVSRFGDAVTVRARVDDEPWRTVRLAPLPPSVPATAGPFCCSPRRAGLRVRFTRFAGGAADTALHVDP